MRNVILSKYMPRNGISRSYRNSVFNFWEICTNLHSHPSCLRFLFFHTLSRIFLFLEFLMRVILTGVRWHLIVGLIFISLIFSDAEHLFMCILTFCMSSLEKCLGLLLIFCLGWFFAVKLYELTSYFWN